MAIDLQQMTKDKVSSCLILAKLICKIKNLRVFLSHSHDLRKLPENKNLYSDLISQQSDNESNFDIFCGILYIT